MKKLALVIMFGLIATAANAQWAANNVGVYFDAAATSNYLASAPAGSPVNAYVVGTGLTAPATCGFELKLTAEGGGLVLTGNAVYPDDAANLATRANEFIVGYADPNPVVGGEFVFMEIPVFILDGTTCCLYIDPIYFPSIPGEKAYLGEDPSILLPLVNSTGNPLDPNGRYPVASINGLCEGAVPTEDASWGSVKGLFR